MEQTARTEPWVSVVMPVYNAEKYLREAIVSVLNQTLTNFEFIVVDDGSTDCSVEIVRSYRDSRIVLLRNDGNDGNYVARNTGMQRAQGKYIAVMDADDIAFPERLMKQYTYMENHPEAGMVGSVVELSTGGLWGLACPSEMMKITLLRTNCVCHPTLFIRRSLVVGHGLFYNENYCYASDYELQIRAAAFTQIHVLQDVLLMYRKHEGQISKKKSRKQMECANQIRLEYIEKTGVYFTNEEKRIFTALYNGEYNKNVAREKYLMVAERVMEANRKSLFFNRQQLAFSLASVLHSIFSS